MAKQKEMVQSTSSDVLRNIPDEVTVEMKFPRNPFTGVHKTGMTLHELVEPKRWLGVNRKDVGNANSALFNIEIPTAVREMLEERLSSPDNIISLKATSKFWGNFMYKVNERPILRPKEDDMDLLYYFVLKANSDIVAMSLREYKEAKPDALYVVFDDKEEARVFVEDMEDEFKFNAAAFTLESKERSKLVSLMLNQDVLNSTKWDENMVQAEFMRLVKKVSATKLSPAEHTTIKRFKGFVNNRNIITKSYLVMCNLLDVNANKFRQIDDMWYYEQKPVGRTPEEIAIKLEHPDYADLNTILYNAA